MTGEMHASEVTPESYPAHFAIARAFKGEVKPFDQYQGPYVLVPDCGRVWIICDGDGGLTAYSEQFDKESCQFFETKCPEDWSNAVAAAREVLPPSREMG